MNKNLIFQELIQNQRKNLSADKKLNLSDLKRISSYLNKSIFTEDECSLWDGYVTEIKNLSAFVNFFFNGKKQALHRLLYYNFINDINDNEYLKFTCCNKGKCCCINHLVLVKEKNKEELDINNKEELDINNKEESEINKRKRKKIKIIKKEETNQKKDETNNKRKKDITVEF
jgi:hypothetical protein